LWPDCPGAGRASPLVVAVAARSSGRRPCQPTAGDPRLGQPQRPMCPDRPGSDRASPSGAAVAPRKRVHPCAAQRGVHSDNTGHAGPRTAPFRGQRDLAFHLCITFGPSEGHVSGHKGPKVMRRCRKGRKVMRRCGAAAAAGTASPRRARSRARCVRERVGKVAARPATNARVRERRETAPVVRDKGDGERRRREPARDRKPQEASPGRPSGAGRG
jgi:hypothetical protein